MAKPRASLSGRESAQPTVGIDAERVRDPGQEAPRPENDVLTQRCPRCGEVKPLEAFYVSRCEATGRTGSCRACLTKWREQNREKRRAADKRYRQRHHEEVLERERNRGDSPQIQASQAVRDAVKSGRLVKPNVCEDCGQDRLLDGHHPDYSKPLEVEWLCSECHGKRHRQPDDLAQVQAEIDAYKAEALSERGKGSVESRVRSPLASPTSACQPRSESVFACTGIDETGYGDLCVCDDPETKPWQRCPEHDGTVD